MNEVMKVTLIMNAQLLLNSAQSALLALRLKCLLAFHNQVRQVSVSHAVTIKTDKKNLRAITKHA
jgi:hypothetical protein